MSLRKLHAVSAVLIAAFACVHIANHLAAATGVASHIAFMNAARTVYRQRVVEVVLLGCIALQVVSGLLLVFRGWKQRHGLIPWLQASSGIYLAFFLIAHVSAVLFGRVALGLDTNFYFAAAGFHVQLFPFFFAPYYFLGVVALFTHIGCAAYWQGQGRPRAVRTFLLVGPVAAGAAAALLIVLMLAGMVFPVEIPAQYKATYIPGNR